MVFYKEFLKNKIESIINDIGFWIVKVNRDLKKGT